MQKEHWIASTLVLAGLCAMLAGAAFYNMREAQRLTALLKNEEARNSQSSAVEAPAVYIQRPPEYRGMPDHYMILDKQPETPKNTRCINGVWIQTKGGEMKSLGRC